MEIPIWLSGTTENRIFCSFLLLRPLRGHIWPLRGVKGLSHNVLLYIKKNIILHVWANYKTNCYALCLVGLENLWELRPRVGRLYVMLGQPCPQNVPRTFLLWLLARYKASNRNVTTGLSDNRGDFSEAFWGILRSEAENNSSWFLWSIFTLKREF